jgi:hypothetical protein
MLGGILGALCGVRQIENQLRQYSLVRIRSSHCLLLARFLDDMKRPWGIGLKTGVNCVGRWELDSLW